MWLPDSLYKVLPVIYAVAAGALLAALGLNNVIGTISAGLLFGASGLIILWRFQHRDETARKKGPSPKEQWAERRARRTGHMPL